MWKLILLICVSSAIVLVQACAPKPKSEDSCNFVQNVYGERVSWKGNLPIILHVHKSFPQMYLPALYEATQIWENAVGRRLFEIANGRNLETINPRQDQVSVVYWMNTWEADKPSEQARTSIYWAGNTIQEADLRINNKNFSFYIDSPAKDTDVQLTSLLVHELGHVLGLKHNDQEPSVMATYLAMHTIRKDLSAQDLTSIECEY
jgi:predicted Zn-dependent protease